MEIRRVFLFSILALFAYNIWIAWQKDYPSTPSTTVIRNQTTGQSQPTDLPLPHGSQNVSEASRPSPASNASTIKQPAVNQGDLISVKTDVFDLHIDLSQGSIIGAKLLDYPVSVDDRNTPITLLTTAADQTYIAKNQLVMLNDSKPRVAEINWTTRQKNYRLATGEDELVVSLEGIDKQGNRIARTFHFKRGDYLIQVNNTYTNQSSKSSRLYTIEQIVREKPKEDPSGLFHIGSFTGASYSNPGEKLFQKVSFKKMGQSDLNVKTQGGWVAMQQHYFLTAWVPEANTKNTIYTRANGDLYTIGLVGPSVSVPPGSSHEFKQKIYIGPEITSDLKAIAPGLDMTIDYGWLWFISSLLFSVMKAIHSVVGNWGWSIVLVTVLIKLVFYRLSATSYKSMANMRQLQPKLEALRQRYADDKAKLSQETMALYKKEKINPLGGCLPILVQIPVFIGLYWVLLESVELRQAPFIGWIQDLSVADPYHILPIVMGLTMLIQQKLNPTPPDPMQAKMMMFLPVVFTALFWSFPAGLVLYWIVNNTLSILQQWYITKKYSNGNSLKGLKKA